MSVEGRRKLFVVADDEQRYRDQVSEAIREASPDARIAQVEGARRLLDHARLGMGDDWIEANAVTLDNRFSKDDRNVWPIKYSPYGYVVDKSLKQAGMEDDHDREQILLVPSASNFAVALRIMGYTGKIISVSNDPPGPEQLDWATKDIDVRRPIMDATILKTQFEGEWICERFSYDEVNRSTVGKPEYIEGSLSDALREMLKM